ncbi:RING-type domain-containing protein [Mycena kentingensis (nom. inval.)]|nr:RING-type domain-containing protein [Mycena kentingensis (nom. inval.)]
MSLVCKSWLRPTRYHLFRKLVFHLGTSREAHLLGLIQDPRCTLLPAVRKVWILPPQQAALPEDTNNNIQLLANRFPNARTLSIHSQRVIPQPTLEVIADAFKDVVANLTMMMRFRSPAHAAMFAASFPKLEELHYELVRTPALPYDTVMPLLSVPENLRKLYLYSIRGYEQWFAQGQNLSELSIDHIRQDDTSVLNELLRLFGTRLKHLTLRFDNQKGDVDWGTDISQNTSDLEVDLSALTKKHVYPLLASASLNAPVLETIVWRNRFSFDGFPEDHWRGLDALLSDPNRLPALSKFEIRSPRNQGERQALCAV